jgi:hypothetical protein
MLMVHFLVMKNTGYFAEISLNGLPVVQWHRRKLLWYLWLPEEVLMADVGSLFSTITDNISFHH